MQRLALEFVRPKMVLARDVYDQDGTIMVSAGTALTDSLLTRLTSGKYAPSLFAILALNCLQFQQRCRNGHETGPG